MAAALAIDRELIHSLVLQGVPRSEIAERTGVNINTLRQWIRRYGWRNPKVTVPISSQPALPSVLSERLAQLTVQQAERILCRLKDIKLSGLRDCKDSAAALSAAYLVARKALGLDDTQPSLHVHYHGAGQPPRVPGPVVDVPPVATQDHNL